MSGMEKLRQALIEQEARQLDEMSEYGDGWEPSADFARKIHSLAYPEKVSLRQKMGSVGRKAAIFAVTAAAVLTLAMQIESTREPIREFVLDNYGKYIVAWFNPLSPAAKAEKLETLYLPSNLPEGYELIAENASRFTHTMSFDNSFGQQIVFTQSVPGGVLDSYISEEEGFEEITVSGKPRMLKQSATDNVCCWTENGYLFYCCASKDVAYETLVDIAEK